EEKFTQIYELINQEKNERMSFQNEIREWSQNITEIINNFRTTGKEKNETNKPKQAPTRKTSGEKNLQEKKEKKQLDNPGKIKVDADELERQTGIKKDWKKIIAYGNEITDDLDTLSHLTKLKKLDLGFKTTRVKKNFVGSLKSLENCKDLEYVCIGGIQSITEELEQKLFRLQKQISTAQQEPNKEKANFQKEKTQFQEILTKHQNKIQQLETQLVNFEKQKQEALTQQKNQIWNQVQQQDNNLRDKINSKLENRLFAAKEKGQTIEQAADNLLEKQNRLTSKINELEAEIGKRGNNLEEAINKLVREKSVNEHYIPTTGDKSIKAYLTVKTGGASGAVSVANSLMSQGNNNNLPQPQGGNLPTQISANNPVNLLPPNTNPQPVINHHYHGFSKKKKRNDPSLMNK
ncbi:7678_t:CDS:2, partial [Racocetra fulgida]